MTFTHHSDALSEARDLGYKVVNVSKKMAAGFDEIAQSYGLTPLQARIVLELTEPKPMRELARAMTCDASNITGFADRLERLGIVERVAGRDRRVKLLSLTKEGGALRNRLADQIGAEALIMAKLNESERRLLEQLLDKLLAGDR